MAASPLLERFVYTSNTCLTAGASALSTALLSCKGLLHLDFESNSLKAEGAIALANSLVSFPLLKTLKLQDAALEEKGVDAVLTALSRCCPDLECLVLAYNDVDVSALKSLPAVLKMKTS